MNTIEQVERKLSAEKINPQDFEASILALQRCVLPLPLITAYVEKYHPDSIFYQYDFIAHDGTPMRVIKDITLNSEFKENFQHTNPKWARDYAYQLIAKWNFLGRRNNQTYKLISIRKGGKKI